MEDAMQVEFKNGKVIVTLSCDNAAIAHAILSSTGKSLVIDGSRGYMGVPGAPDGVKVSVNLITTNR
jgi:hypothetical protein